MKVFLDTSFIVSSIIKTDSNHEKAKKLIINEDLLNNECYISNLIINEIITVIGNKLGLTAAIEAYELVNDNFNILNEYEINNFILNEYEINNFNDKVLDVYRLTNTKLSFTDSSIIILMQEYGIENLVSFDKEFKRIKNINWIY